MRIILTLTIVALTAISAAAEERIAAILYKIPQCRCCDDYASYLRTNGFDVKVVASSDMSLIRTQQGVSADLEGCHTTLVGGYVVEGHVPVSVIKRLLAEKPAIKGISLPGMPLGSPGMTGTKKAPFTIFAITPDGERPHVYAIE